MRRLFPALFLLCAECAVARAATVDFVEGQASAPPQARLAPGDRFTTGRKSRAQLSGEGGFFRVGSDAAMSFSKGGVALEKGILLTGSEPSPLRRSVGVAAPGYQLSVTGTVLVAYYPGKYIKITVLEGRVKVALRSLAGEFETLTPGQMLIINPSDRRLPEPVEVDISRLVSTSQLLAGAQGLKTQGLIDSAIVAQNGNFKAGEIARTSYILAGASPELSLAQSALPSAPSTKRPSAPQPSSPEFQEQAVFNVQNDLGDPGAIATFLPYGDASLPFPRFPSDSGTIVIPRDPTLPRTGLLEVTLTALDSEGYLNVPTLHGTISADPKIFGGAGPLLRFRTLDSLDTNAPDAIYALTIEPQTTISTPHGVGLSFSGSLGLAVSGATLTAGESSSADEVLSLGATSREVTISDSTLRGYSAIIDGSTDPHAGDQKIIVTGDKTSIVTRTDLAIGGQDTSAINISQATLTAGRDLSVQTNGRTIAIDAGAKLTAGQSLTIGSTNDPSPSGITISNSSQLQAMVELAVLTNGKPISVDGSTLTATKNLTIDSGELGGLVTLRNAVLSADVIRVRGSSASGDALVIDGGTMTATLLKLYAGSNGTLRFRKDVNLKADQAILAGQTVEVENGGRVSISGKGTVYTKNANFNQPNFGTISDIKGQVTHSKQTPPNF